MLRTSMPDIDRSLRKISLQNGNGPKTPSPTETQRLHAQHLLIKHAFGGLVLCPIDLSRPNLRVLDSGTSDGYWLRDLRCQLGHPDSADLIGTDIAILLENPNLPPNVKLMKQDIKEDWPADWEGTFDLVHQRNVMSIAGSFDNAVKIIQKLVRLLKPGGCIQLIEGCVPAGEVNESDSPSVKMFTMLGNYLLAIRRNPTIGKQVLRLLETAGSLTEIESKQAVSRFGDGASPHLLQAGFLQLQSLGAILKSVSGQIPNSDMTKVDWDDLNHEVMAEAIVKGVDMEWYAAWGRKVV